MSFAGLKDVEDRVNLIAYLNTQGDSPVDFSAVTEP
jgi:cytochrome c2